MKKCLSMILACVLLLGLCACDQEDPNSRTIYLTTFSSTVYEDGNMLIVEYTYDSKNRPTQSVHTYNFGGYMSSVTYTHECNEFGQTISQTDGVATTEYDYNEAGEMVSARIYYNEQLDGMQKFYYENGQMVKAEWYSYGILTAYTEYSYNMNNRTAKAVSYDSAGAKTDYSEYKYTSDGKSCTVKNYSADGALLYTQTIDYKPIKVPVDSPRKS